MWIQAARKFFHVSGEAMEFKQARFIFYVFGKDIFSKGNQQVMYISQWIDWKPEIVSIIQVGWIYFLCFWWRHFQVWIWCYGLVYCSIVAGLAHANKQLLGFYLRRLTNKLTAFITLWTDITQWQSHDQSQLKGDNFLLHQSTVNQVQFWYLPTLKGLNPLFSTVVLLPTICELSLVLDRKKEWKSFSILWRREMS